jgi:hypothetical protein
MWNANQQTSPAGSRRAAALAAAADERSRTGIYKEIQMKKLAMSFWLALAAAGLMVVQASGPFSHQSRMDDPMPTCPPECGPIPQNVR